MRFGPEHKFYVVVNPTEHSTLEDIVFRRMMIGFDADQGRAMYDDVAAIAAEEWDWSPDQKTQQLAQLTTYADSLRTG